MSHQFNLLDVLSECNRRTDIAHQATRNAEHQRDEVLAQLHKIEHQLESEHYEHEICAVQCDSAQKAIALIGNTTDQLHLHLQKVTRNPLAISRNRGPVAQMALDLVASQRRNAHLEFILKSQAPNVTWEQRVQDTLHTEEILEKRLIDAGERLECMQAEYMEQTKLLRQYQETFGKLGGKQSSGSEGDE